MIAIIISFIVGGLIGWLAAKAKVHTAFQEEKERKQLEYNESVKEYTAYKATSIHQLETAASQLAQKQVEIDTKNKNVQEKQLEASSLASQLSMFTADLRASRQTIVEKNDDIIALKEELRNRTGELAESNEQLARTKAVNEALDEKLEKQKIEIEEMGIKFNTEFENIANKIFDSKTEKFTELNKENLNRILEPLGKNITEFKTKVEEVYNKEAKERFSLGEKVKELAALNQLISEEARNLTKALKGEAKTQGRWGEMILENILEKSGLVKDREYFMEYELRKDDGTALKSDAEGKKMRPDVVIKYPDNRNVIIDAKVSLNAFVRFSDAADLHEQKTALQSHLSAVKAHIVALSTKGYDDYDKALDFVMMFIPSEPAYIAALQADSNLWHFAYEKRILLLSPTNLITSLKLIVDLWKREYQNRNAQEIAERGAKLYDKFVNFVSNLDDVGTHLTKAQDKYNEAYKQLSTGNDNLVTQATKLKNLGLTTRKELPLNLVNSAIGDDTLQSQIEKTEEI